MGKTKLNSGRKEAGSGRSFGATTRDKHVETLLVGHDLVVMHRLMEISKKLELMDQAVI